MTNTLLMVATVALIAIANAITIHIAARQLKSPSHTVSKSIGVSIVLLGLIALVVTGSFQAHQLVAWYISVPLGLGLLATCWYLIFKFAFRLPWRNTSLLVALTIGATLASAAIPVFGRVMFLKAYKLPTNAMAPTLRGRHFVGICPTCQGKLIISGRMEPGSGFLPDERGICSNCLQIHENVTASNIEMFVDRMLVDYLVQPKRWDIIVFRFPQNPNEFYVMRLVGLPGESIQIRDGKIFINEEQLPNPPELKSLRWDVDENSPVDDVLAVRQPFTLGPDEYFTLGDYSTNSYDSRYWGPVPTENVVGTVTTIYWPPNRWSVLPSHD